MLTIAIRNLAPIRARQRGVSLVELLVGVAIGLFLIAGAASLFVSNLSSSRKLLVEARVNQDLRAAADLISRDLRRAGYWENAILGTVATSTVTTPPRNQYATVTPTASSIGYAYARDANDTVQAATEQFGFQLQGGALEMRTAGAWQVVTDPAVVTITGLVITSTVTPIDVRDSCPRTCCDSVGGTCAAINVSPALCPRITVRQYEVVLTGQAANDPAVVRTLRTRVRMRNDLLEGTCPV